MKTLNIPNPPNPDAQQFKSNPLAYNRASYLWMMLAKGAIEQAHNSVATPCGQQMQVSAFTTATTLTGTSTGTAVSNYLCSLVQALTNKGIISPSITIGDTQ
jgi:hypothetical protein